MRSCVSVSFSSSEVELSDDVSSVCCMAAENGLASVKEVVLVCQSFCKRLIALLVMYPRLSSNWYRKVSGCVVGSCKTARNTYSH